MAKVEGPLISTAGVGKLADSYIFYDWKGKKILRSLKGCEDRNSKAQKQLRENFKKASQLSSYLTQSDKDAWKRLAGLSDKNLTWHNYFTGLFYRLLKAGVENCNLIYGINPIETSSEKAIFEGRVLHRANLKVRWGEAPTETTRCITVPENKIEGGRFKFSLNNLSSKRKYYFKINEIPHLTFPPQDLNKKIVGAPGQKTRRALLLMSCKNGEVLFDTSRLYSLENCPDPLDNYNYMELNWPHNSQVKNYSIYLLCEKNKRLYLQGETNRNFFLLCDEKYDEATSLPSIDPNTGKHFSTLARKSAGVSGLYSFNTAVQNQ